MRAPDSFPNEEELVRELDVHDDLVTRCARADLSFGEFEKAYDAFYPRHALDWHESDAAARQVLAKHEARIALHRDIWDEVLTRVTADEYLGQPATVAAGFIDSEEAVRRLRSLLQRHAKAGGRDPAGA